MANGEPDVAATRSSRPRARPGREPLPGQSPMRGPCLRIARGRLAACSLDGRGGHRGTWRNTAREALTLDHEIGDVKGLTDDAKAVELEPYLLVHRVAGVEAHHHGNTGSNRVKELRKLRAGKRYESRGDDDQRHRRLEHLTEAVTKSIGHANGYSVLEALQADRLGQRTIPIDHQHACHGIPFRVYFGTSVEQQAKCHILRCS